MDEIRKIARACYNGAAGTEKKLARKLFRSLDINGDGKVSLREYKKALVHASFSNSDFFEELDANCDGTLDFHESLALYYMDKVSVPRCSACKSLLIHSYFSCLPCQADVSFYLCCDCYERGKFKHHHSSNKFVDTRAMLKLLDQILKHAQIPSHQTDEGALGGDQEEDEAEYDDNEVEEEERGSEEDDDDDDEDKEDVDDEEDGVDEFDDLNLDGKTTKRKGKAAAKRSKRGKVEKIIEAIKVAGAVGGPVVQVGAIAVAATTCCIM